MLYWFAGLLKLYFREISEPLFTDRLYTEFVTAPKIADPTTRSQKLAALLSELPPAHLTTIKFLVAHLRRVAAHGDSNKMRNSNIAIVFGPTLVRMSQPTTESIIMHAAYQSSVVELLLENTELV
jgi:hypothetical protein